MNLLISFITLAAALVVRANTLSIESVMAMSDVVVALAASGAIGAAWGAGWLARLSDHGLERLIAWLLAGIGVLLIGEAAIDADLRLSFIEAAAARIAVGLVCGVVIGAVAALLGVAGGELLIPTLLFVFGADIATAGTASLMISLVTVSSGLWRYHRLGLLPGKPEIAAIGLPVGSGSIIGAALGGVAVGWIAAPLLKLILGIVLVVAAAKAFWRKRAATSSATA